MKSNISLESAPGYLLDALKQFASEDFDSNQDIKTSLEKLVKRVIQAAALHTSDISPLVPKFVAHLPLFQNTVQNGLLALSKKTLEDIGNLLAEHPATRSLAAPFHDFINAVADQSSSTLIDLTQAISETDILEKSLQEHKDNQDSTSEFVLETYRQTKINIDNHVRLVQAQLEKLKREVDTHTIEAQETEITRLEIELRKLNGENAQLTADLNQAVEIQNEEKVTREKNRYWISQQARSFASTAARYMPAIATNAVTNIMSKMRTPTETMRVEELKAQKAEKEKQIRETKETISHCRNRTRTLQAIQKTERVLRRISKLPERAKDLQITRLHALKKHLGSVMENLSKYRESKNRIRFFSKETFFRVTASLGSSTASARLQSIRQNRQQKVTAVNNLMHHTRQAQGSTEKMLRELGTLEKGKLNHTLCNQDAPIERDLSDKLQKMHQAFNEESGKLKTQKTTLTSILQNAQRTCPSPRRLR